MGNEEYNILLNQAARDGDLAECKRLLDLGADLNATAAIAGLAVDDDKHPTVNVDKTWYQAKTPLMTAIAVGNADIALWLLQNGAQVNFANQDGWTALHQFAWSSNNFKTQAEKLLVLDALIAHGAKLDAKVHDLTPNKIAKDLGMGNLIYKLSSALNIFNIDRNKQIVTVTVNKTGSRTYNLKFSCFNVLSKIIVEQQSAEDLDFSVIKATSDAFEWCNYGINFKLRYGCKFS